MLVIFPFEEPFYRERGVAGRVRRPSARRVAPAHHQPRAVRRRRTTSTPPTTWIGLLPGSRPNEIRDHLPEMLEARAEPALPRTGSPAVEFLVPLAPTLNAAQRAARCPEMREDRSSGRPSGRIRLVDDARAALFHARASVVASGTATVEAALIGNPFVVVYRVSPVTYAIAKRIVKVPHVAMANLIAGKRVVPELIQHDFTAANIVQQLEPLLPDGAASPVHDGGASGSSSRAHPAAGEEGEQAASAIERVAAITLEELEAAAAGGRQRSSYVVTDALPLEGLQIPPSAGEKIGPGKRFIGR